MIGQWSDSDQGVGVFKGQRNDDQLWSFEPVGAYYKIRSCKYTNRVFSKWGSWDSSWGTYRDTNAEDQLWSLKPRFTATAVQTQIWAVDNRGGSNPFTETREVTQGLKLTQSSTISTTVNLEATLGFTIPIKMPIEVGLSMKGEITKSLTRGSEETWSTKSTINFTAPAGRNYRVTQFIVTFKSEIPGDEIALYTNYKVEETTGALPHLRKNFFLNGAKKFTAQVPFAYYIYYYKCVKKYINQSLFT